ncbi:hypothetical protein SAMN06265795_103267 [Noviherbaspirillum humi]|uniref:ATP-grasp domain-containing protein n=1 Tax=Noviherbaspirillum humi TaxID=1688639 RepID=A0A239FAQ7_9BURK|nr:hypothetical protein [Noviherbaspirillum humi]SNS53885.1 hypothetical protein SAMN06265795_103267 [Noviherbaspirillum humi]
MINFIVVGSKGSVILAVLQAIRSFTDARSVVIGGEDSRHLRWSTLCERHCAMRFDGSDDDRFVSIVGHFMSRTPHLVLIPADSEGARLVNRVRDRLSVNIIPTPDRPTLEMMDDPTQLQRFCTLHGIATPRTCLLRRQPGGELPAFHALAAEVGLPFALRRAGCGDAGSQVISSQAEYELALNQLAGAPDQLLAQAWVEGDEVDIGLLADRGQVSVLSLQQNGADGLRFISHAGLEAMAARLCQASAYHGPLRLRARINRSTGEVCLLGSQAQFWESLPTAIWRGVNFVAESIRQTPRQEGVRRPLPGLAFRSHPLVCADAWKRFFSSDEPGRLLRAMTLDVCSLGTLIGSPRSMPRQGEGLSRRVARRFESMRRHAAPAATRTLQREHV